MSELNQPVTNPGSAENLARQTSLADAIAANLTAGREAAEQRKEQEQSERRPAPRESRPIAEAAPEPEEQGELELEAAPETPETPEVPEVDEGSETPERYTLADFAAAAETDVDTLVSLLDVEVTGKDGATTANLRDVLNGYKWDAVNTQRAQEVAEQRRQAEAKMAEVQQMHAQAEAVVQAQWGEVAAEEQALEQQYRSMPWEQLRARGDGSYADAEAQFARRRTELETRKRRLADAYTQVQQQREAFTEQMQREEIPKQEAKLREYIPEWSDTDKGRRDMADIAHHFAERYGFGAEDVGNITDARIWRVLHRLWQIDSQEAAAPLATKKVRAAPKMLKPGQKGSQQSAKQKRVRDMRGRLKKSGKREDLAALVLENMRG